jgi:hypothetical protein
MPKLSEVAGSAETVKRVQVQNASVADVVPPPWTKKRTLGAQKKKG